MRYVMLVNQVSLGLNCCHSQVSVWQGEVLGSHQAFVSGWFPNNKSQVLIQQLAMADRIRIVAGPETKLRVLHDGNTGFFPGEELPVSEFIKKVKRRL